jgi:hypothetical protein
MPVAPPSAPAPGQRATIEAAVLRELADLEPEEVAERIRDWAEGEAPPTGGTPR